MDKHQRLATLRADLDGWSSLDLLRWVIVTEFPGRIAVTSSFGAESAVLLDLVARVNPAVPVLFMDTDALFDETVAYRDALAAHLGLTDLRVVRPAWADLRQAEDLWRDDPETCCHLRKVKPFAAAAAGFDALIDGRKSLHGGERAGLPVLSLDAAGTFKVSPLAHWTEDDVERAFVERGLPRHPLVARGYRSIGCWPCTRPVAPGEAPRSGRWAGRAKAECGIHTYAPASPPSSRNA